MPPAQQPAAAPAVTAAVSADNAEASNNVAPSAGTAEANVVHPEVEAISAEAVAAWQRALAGDGEQIDRAAIEKKIKAHKK